MKNVFLSLFLLATLWQGVAYADDLAHIRAIMKWPDKQIDLGKVKLVIDKMIDPSINIKASLKKIDSMVNEIKAKLPTYASNSDKLQALRTYLYVEGDWNGYQPYEYDFADPFGENIRHKLLTNYLMTKRGNCVSMPLLFIILGQRLGLDMTAAVAPMHILVRLRDDMGNQINLEATSGANPARDVWIRQQIPMTDNAVANGVYLSPLSKKETVALMVETLIEYDMQQREYEKAIEASDLVLEYSPKAVNAMIHKGAAYARLIKEQFISQYPSPNLIPQEMRAYYEYLDRNNRLWYANAEELGWREPTEANEAQYQQTVNHAKLVH